MVREILTYPKDKEILTQKSVEVTEFTDEIKELINDLIDTVKAKNGAGISAIQLGKPYRICVINWGGIYVLVNPVVTRERGSRTFREGCLSVPGLFVDVVRPQKVWITALNQNGEEFEFAEGGNGSTIALHELDHFEGKCELFDAYEEAIKQLGENGQNE